MKVELTMEQADLLLLELSALIQDFNHPKETIEQIMDIRQQIAQSIVSEKEARGKPILFFPLIMKTFVNNLYKFNTASSSPPISPSIDRKRSIDPSSSNKLFIHFSKRCGQSLPQTDINIHLSM